MELLCNLERRTEEETATEKVSEAEGGGGGDELGGSGTHF